MHHPGRFIVVEGLEGAGKTTAIRIIKEHLEAIAPSIILTREPGGTRVGERLRNIVKESMGGELIDPICELLLMYAARAQLLGEVIYPALNRGDWVISDRFELSTYAYQGGGRGISKAVLDSLSTICLKQFQPDLIIFLDVSPEQGLNRAKQRGKMDRIEQESLDFFRNVHHAYHQTIRDRKNVCIVDANASLSTVQESIIDHLNTWLASYD